MQYLDVMKIKDLRIYFSPRAIVAYSCGNGPVCASRISLALWFYLPFSGFTHFNSPLYRQGYLTAHSANLSFVLRTNIGGQGDGVTCCFTSRSTIQQRLVSLDGWFGTWANPKDLITIGVTIQDQYQQHYVVRLQAAKASKRDMRDIELDNRKRSSQIEVLSVNILIDIAKVLLKVVYPKIRRYVA